MEDRIASVLIEKLGLKPHPEGGYFAETFRSSIEPTLTDGRVRAASTAIYFLLPSGSFSALHRVSSDEVWHFYDGEPLELVSITPEGVLECTLLGRNLTAGERPQHVVPAGVWQAARMAGAMGVGYSLVGCTVAPGFDFEDFDMPGRASLMQRFPRHAEFIRELTRG